MSDDKPIPDAILDELTSDTVKQFVTKTMDRGEQILGILAEHEDVIHADMVTCMALAFLGAMMATTLNANDSEPMQKMTSEMIDKVVRIGKTMGMEAKGDPRALAIFRNTSCSSVH